MAEDSPVRVIDVFIDKLDISGLGFNIDDGLIDTVDLQARIRNLLGLANEDHTGDQMFDQILASPEMAAFYVDGSARVFNHEDAARGNDSSRASDHLPVLADFILQGDVVTPSAATLRITRVLPNPAGSDDGNETITLFNPGQTDIDLSGWRIVDRAGNSRSLSGNTVAPGGSTTITLAAPAMLNNSGGGDDIELLGPHENPVDSASYQASQVVPGVEIVF